MKLILQASILFFYMTVTSGIIYPAVVTGIAQVIWPQKSAGSLVTKNDVVIGSAIIAQQFKSPEYFWPRPSASSFNANPAGASNLGPTSAHLLKNIEERRDELATLHQVSTKNIPEDLITTSASGLDPHISVEAARLQIKRVALARGQDETGTRKIAELINNHTEKPQLFFLGEKRVNVLMLNLALDQCCKKK